MVQVTDLTDAGGAVGADDTDLAGGHTDLGVGALLSHQLGIPWGKPALGYKTRKKKNPTDKFIVKRRNVK